MGETLPLSLEDKWKIQGPFTPGRREGVGQLSIERGEQRSFSFPLRGGEGREGALSLSIPSFVYHTPSRPTSISASGEGRKEEEGHFLLRRRSPRSRPTCPPAHLAAITPISNIDAGQASTKTHLPALYFSICKRHCKSQEKNIS